MVQTHAGKHWTLSLRCQFVNLGSSEHISVSIGLQLPCFPLGGTYRAENRPDQTCLSSHTKILKQGGRDATAPSKHDATHAASLSCLTSTARHNCFYDSSTRLYTLCVREPMGADSGMREEKPFRSFTGHRQPLSGTGLTHQVSVRAALGLGPPFPALSSSSESGYHLK